jgi:hypothetical protein
MKYLRRTAGYTLLDHKINKEILEELHITPLEEKLCTYRLQTQLIPTHS